MSKPPKQDISLTITVSETKEGKLRIQASIPSEAAGTVALVMVDTAIKVMQEMMREVGIPPETQGVVQ